MGKSSTLIPTTKTPKPSGGGIGSKTLSDYDRRKLEEKKVEDQLKKLDDMRNEDLAMSKARENRDLLKKRGEKLDETADKAQQLSDHAGQFHAMAVKLKNKQKNSLFGF